jgi:hypothetical protein
MCGFWVSQILACPKVSLRALFVRLSPIRHTHSERATESLLDVEIYLGGLSCLFSLLSPTHSICGDKGR